MPSTSLAAVMNPSAYAGNLSAGRKLLLLVANATALLQIAVIVWVIWAWRQSPGVALAWGLGILYLTPPLLCRLLLVVWPIRQQYIPIGSRDFFVWWFALNQQMLFCRFPALEEVLRVVPGCYSLWLRLWGAKIGKLTYWGAGLRILDRSFVVVGDHVTLGAGVKLNPHVMLPDAEGRMMLVLAPVRIGDRSSVGGYSLLVAGTEIGPGQATRAFLILPPFSRLEQGRRHKGADLPAAVEE